jgi:hypothetical protein
VRRDPRAGRSGIGTPTQVFSVKLIRRAAGSPTALES